MAASRVGAAAGELEECGGGRAGGARRRTGVQWCEQEPMAGPTDVACGGRRRMGMTCGGHMSVSREMTVAGTFWFIRKYGGGGAILIHLQLGPTWCRAYIMAYFQQQVNCNGTSVVS